MQCGTTCVNLQSDNQNCGTCGKVCQSGSTCTAGSCACTGGFVSCGGGCVQSNPQHCGTGCTACASGDVCDSTGICSSTCSSGTKCPDGTCGGLTNAADCGTCGTACGSGSSCVNGSCSCTVAGQQLCGGSCIDTSSNASNCGSCSHACASGQTCSNGTCTTVSTGTGGATGSGGSGNGGGAGNAAGGVSGTGGLSRGPTPPSNGTNFPFPQNRQISGCTYPAAYDNNDVMAAYTKWKTDLITANGAGGFQRVQRTTSDGLGSPSGATPLNSTVSEGIGYGMVIAVYMGDHTLFDNLWKYEQLHTDGNGLMNWVVDASGNAPVVNGQPEGGAATDADEDMAWALVMADKQWGSSGALKYADLAKTQIQNIWNHEVYMSKLTGPGDSWPGNLFDDVNASYFAPAYYRVFKQVDTDSTHNWDAVTQTVFDTIFCDKSGTTFCNVLNASNKNTTNGLVPGWATNTGGMSSAGPYYYQYDACRTPFRLGIDWCLNGASAASAAAGLNPSRAQQYVALTSSFFSGVGAANIVDGYNMDGTVNSSAHSVSQGQSAAFIGPAAVGAMNSASNQAFLNEAYTLVKGDNLFVGGAYYEESWTVMSLLMMTGNFLDYTQITPATN